jgi:hypothetical protein
MDKLFKYTQTAKEIQVFVLEGTNIVPWNLSETKYNINVKTMNYVLLKINDKEKILVFDNRNTLIQQYGNLKKLVENKSGHFCHYMEVIKDNDLDVVDLFNKYDDKDNTFFVDITKYELKPCDLYDFTNNKFLLEPNSSLEVVKMDLEKIKYNYNDSMVKYNVNYVTSIFL